MTRKEKNSQYWKNIGQYWKDFIEVVRLVTKTVVIPLTFLLTFIYFASIHLAFGFIALGLVGFIIYFYYSRLIPFIRKKFPTRHRRNFSKARNKPIQSSKPIQKSWKNVRAGYQKNKYEFMNAISVFIEQAVRHIYQKQFGRILPSTTAAVLRISRKFHIQDLPWIWACRNEFAHQGTIGKVPVGKIPQNVAKRLFQGASSLMEKSFPNKY